METQDILENNILIDLFMGATLMKRIGGDKYALIRNTRDTGTERYPKDLFYHKHWDWIMPVVEKIEGTTTPQGWYYDFDILSTGIVVENAYGRRIANIDNDQITTIGKKQAVYLACVEFIKWYNQNV